MANAKLQTDILIQGSLYIEDGSTAEATTDATPRKIAAFTTDGSSLNCTPAHASDQITIGKAGYITVDCRICFSGTLSKTFVVEIYKNGSPTNYKLNRKLGTGGDVGSASCMWEGLVAANDIITVYHSSTDGGSAFTVTDAQLVVSGFASSA